MINKSGIDFEKEEAKAKLKGSLLLFTQFFFKHLNNRDFIVTTSPGREPVQITICKILTDLFRNPQPYRRLIINVPPGCGKSTLVSYWMAWCEAQYPDSNFLFVSNSHDLASKHTHTVKQIISSAMYDYLFGVSVKRDSSAKDRFTMSGGGTIRAFGATGPVVGQDGGLLVTDRFSGAVVCDDMHKPSEGTSTTIRESVIKNYEETIRQRPRGTHVPIVFIGQRVHEEDLPGWLLAGNDVVPWEKIVLPSIDDAGNSIYPEIMPLTYLRGLQEKSPYVFASQYQQEPIPAGGSLFNPEWFVLLTEEPHILETFITADTAETSKSYNDATVFSFWGLYEIESMGRKTGELGLHWLDCLELRIEPKDLKEAFLDFWAECMRHRVPPKLAAIEKKSTGVTLASVLSELRAIQIRDVTRTAASGSKATRYIEMQPYIAGKYVSVSEYARHKQLVLDHMSKITATDAHRFDDIADTLYDAVRIALIDKSLYTTVQDKPVNNEALDIINRDMMLRKKLGVLRYG